MAGNYQHIQVQKDGDILRKQFIYSIVFVLGLKTLWLIVGMKIMVKILQKLCIANLTQDRYENGAIIQIAVSENQP